MHGTCVGIVGLGAIGEAVARRLRGFGVELLGHDVLPRKIEGVAMVPLDELLRRADIVTVHTPLNDSTSGLIAERELALMRPEAIIVNTARGGIVDETALADALRSGRLRAAGLDVFNEEPPTGSPLLGLPNVVLSPHVAGLSTDSIRRMLQLASRSVVDVLAGRKPAGLVDPAALAAP
jgi:phosphoglycerate dehydrogenase-like enzyme